MTKRVQVHEINGSTGVFISKSSNTQTTWAGNENLEVETVTTNISLDEAGFRQRLYDDWLFKDKIQKEMDLLLKTKLKELIKQAMTLDVIIWKDEDADTFTTQVIIDGDVCLEKSVQVAVPTSDNKELVNENDSH